MTDTILSLRNLKKRFGSATPADDFSIDIRRGEFFTMLGPSGSGKSTILRMIAGLEAPDSGAIWIDGQDMTRTPPWGRHLGMVFQHYAVFPHMTVAGNVGYGLRNAGASPAETRARVAELLQLVGLPGFEGRRVTQLSGGEQQRVAIARALAPRPTILLLDEPLSALDEKVRREMQTELRGIHQRTGTTFIYVTHDQEEALTMSDRVAVLNRGRYVQCDAPKAIFRRPRTPFVARFFRGCNVLDAGLAPEGSGLRVSIAGRSVCLPGSLAERPAGKVAIRGESIAIGEGPEVGLTLPALVRQVTYRGLYTSCDLQLDDGQMLAATRSTSDEIREGDKVTIRVSGADVIPLEAD